MKQMIKKHYTKIKISFIFMKGLPNMINKDLFNLPIKKMNSQIVLLSC